jgi:sterol desaturase/sphingolipid hydroxylase (fatty acid hydroxylase superfamily)
MEGHKITHEKEPVRLFKSDFLEFFTHIHPAVIVAIWLPVDLVLLGLGIAALHNDAAIWIIPAGILVGLFFWTFTEYTLHRFLFHFRPRTPAQEWISFHIHGVHHYQPQDKTRLVMPPVISIPLALIFYGLFQLIGNLLGLKLWIFPALTGFIAGYLTYDLTHYATHHFPMRGRISKYLKRYHMQHHYKTPNARFGVSSPLWDIVFGTKPG